jgi:predicted dehydrogenase
MRVAIVGCGLIGQKRARSLAGARLVTCCDIVGDRAAALARSCEGVDASDDWQATVVRPDVDIVIVATTHNMLARIAEAAAAAGKHVLIEKPGARTPGELTPVIEAAQRTGALVRVGSTTAIIERFGRPARSSNRVLWAR